MCPHPTPWDKQDWCRRVNKRHYHRAVDPVVPSSVPSCPFPPLLPVHSLSRRFRSERC